MLKTVFYTLLVLTFWCATPAAAVTFDLRFDRLAEALGILPDNDRKAVEDIIQLIKRGENTDAYQRLSELNKTNPSNSSLRVLTSYALLQLGNAIGALEEADKAHDAPNGNSYKCLFFAKIAFLNGQTEACKRELGHARKAGDLPKEVKALEKEMKGKS
ncbi:MAG: hypothetical protein JST93_37215 [Acidobacteria bacterium]|nr:hypothetical protein [Acidobacteriota bacterium]